MALDISAKADILKDMKKRILFLCTHNSCRSQMAEGLVNHYLGDHFSAFSAGTEATRVNPLAVQVLAELGIDTSRHYSKTLDEFSGQQTRSQDQGAQTAEDLRVEVRKIVDRVSHETPQRKIVRREALLATFRAIRAGGECRAIGARCGR